jgi:glycine cleavage system H lipoate-binding protein
MSEKVVSICRKFWLEETPNEGTSIGFTQDYLEALGVVWVFSPKPAKSVKEGEVFANVESSKFLGPLRCPTTGKVNGWNVKALEHPESLTVDDYLIKVQ